MRRVAVGAGYGSIDGVRLSILLLADARHEATMRAIARALGRHHDIAAFAAPTHGPSVWLLAAKKAVISRPHLVHAIGIDGAARPAALIASGMGIPLAQTLTRSDLGLAPAYPAVSRASAVLVEDGDTASTLRKKGIERTLYVIANPNLEMDDARFLGALEIIYGRIVTPTDGAARPSPGCTGARDVSADALVQLEMSPKK